MLPEKEVIQATEQERLIYVYNSLPYERNELICLFSSSFAVEILDTARSPVAVQITPSIYRIGEKLEISASAFEVFQNEIEKFSSNLLKFDLIRFVLLQTLAHSDFNSIVSEKQKNSTMAQNRS